MLMFSRLIFILLWVAFYISCGYALLFSSKSNAQETTHNELHKAYESALQGTQTKYCFGNDIRLTRKSSFIANQQTGEVTPALFKAECIGQNNQLLYAVNLAGGIVTEDNGSIYMTDPFNEVKCLSDEPECQNLKAINTWYYIEEDKTWPLYLPGGRYRFTLFERPNDCPGWEISYNTQKVVGLGGANPKKYELIIDVDSTIGMVNFISFKSSGCRALFYALEIWRLKRLD